MSKSEPQPHSPHLKQASFFHREKLTRDQKLARVEVANQVLKSFAPSTCLSLRESSNGGDRVSVTWHWKNFKTGERESKSRQWHSMTGSDFYPTWGDEWSYGNTAMTALSQLVRWVRGLPVLPVVPTWKYWASGQCGLMRHNENGELRKYASGKARSEREPWDVNDWVLSLLLSAGYPEVASCILCGEPIVDNGDGKHRGIDWWSMRRIEGDESSRVSGPCCMWGMCLNDT